MHPSSDIERLMADLGSRDRKVALSAADLLGGACEREGHAALIEALADPSKQHFAALGVHEGRVQDALPHLLQLIKDPSNLGKTGTYVFALEALDCRTIGEDLFDIMFVQGYESHISASRILDEQKFSFDDKSRNRILNRWELIQKDPSTCPDFEDKRKDIEALVHRYLASK
jgi:hypothetical protein